MTKITLLSLVAASVLFTACGDNTKKAAAEATAKTTEVAKETASDLEKAASDAAEATKKAAEELAKAAKEKADEASAAAEKAADELKERAVATTEAAKKELSKAVVSESEGEAGALIYAKCSSCHGKDGKTKALGKSEVVAGQSAGDLVTKLKEYKEGKRNVSGMGTLMKGQVTSLSEGDILSVSEYISGL